MFNRNQDESSEEKEEKRSRRSMSLFVPCTPPRRVKKRPEAGEEVVPDNFTLPQAALDDDDDSLLPLSLLPSYRLPGKTKYGRTTRPVAKDGPEEEVKALHNGGHSSFNRCTDSEATVVLIDDELSTPGRKLRSELSDNEKLNLLTPTKFVVSKESPLTNSPLELKTQSPLKRVLVRCTKAVIEDEKFGSTRKTLVSFFGTAESAAFIPPPPTNKKKKKKKLSTEELAANVTKKLTEIPRPQCDTYEVKAVIGKRTLEKARKTKRKTSHTIPATAIANHFGIKDDEFDHSHGTAHSHGATPFVATNGKDSFTTLPAPRGGNTTRLLTVENPMRARLLKRKYNYTNKLLVAKDKKKRRIPVLDKEFPAWDNGEAKVTFEIDHSHKGDRGIRNGTPPKQLQYLSDSLFKVAFREKERPEVEKLGKVLTGKNRRR